MKVTIPPEHYHLYQKIYSYLNETLTTKKANLFFKNFSEEIISGYLKNNRVPNNLKKNKLIDEKKPTFKLKPTTSISELKKLHQDIYTCQKCFLGPKRQQSIAFPNQQKANLMVVNSIPSYYDQIQGEYFHDEAGQLFLKIFSALSLELKKIYFTSSIKCSWSVEVENQLEKVAICQEHLIRELEIIKPQFILAFGSETYQFLFKKNDFESIRGKKIFFQNIPIVFTYHPKELLRDERLKKECWQDLKKHTNEIKGLL